MADKTLLDLAIENPRGWGEAPPQAGLPSVAYVDDAGNQYGDDGRLIARWQTPTPGADPSLGESLLNIAESPAKMLVGAVTEPVNALHRLAQNSVDENGNIAIPNPRNPQNKQDVLTGLLSMYGGNAMNPGRAAEAIAPKLLSDTGKPSIPGAVVAGAEKQPGFDVWHGSPHDFDQFDISKIGTGEGAQVYGHGLYFAENPNVAKGYQKDLGTRSMVLNGRGDELDIPTRNLGIDDVRKLRESATDPTIQGNLDQALSQMANGMSFEDLAKDWPRYPFRHTFGDDIYQTPGYLYQARVNADPGAFLDWDSPLNQQNASVADAVKRAMGINYQNEFDPAKAQRLWDAFQHADAGTAIKNGFFSTANDRAADMLRDAGVPGIRYLDQGSRGAREGSRNYVLFSDDPVDIIHKWRGDQQLYSDTGKPSLMGSAVAGAEANTPVRAFHATNADFDKFDPAFTNEVGFHFGDKGTANNRAYIRANGNPFSYMKYRNIPVEMDVQNPAALSRDVTPNYSGLPLAKQLVSDGIAPKSLLDDLAGKPQPEQNATVRNWLVDNGYDAVKYPNQFEGGGKPSYMALGTGNVKHAKTGDVLYAGAPPIPSQDDQDQPLSLADLALIAGR